MHNRIVVFFSFVFTETRRARHVERHRVIDRGHRSSTLHLFDHPKLEDLPEETLAWMPIRVVPKREAARVAYLSPDSSTVHGPIYDVPPHVVHNALIAGSSAASGSLQTEVHRLCGVVYCVRYNHDMEIYRARKQSFHFPLLHATHRVRMQRNHHQTRQMTDGLHGHPKTRAPRLSARSKSRQSTTLSTEQPQQALESRPRASSGVPTWWESVRPQGTTQSRLGSCDLPSGRSCCLSRCESMERESSNAC